MSSFKEKNKLQDEIIDDIFDKLSKECPKSEDFFNDYFFKQLEELFEIEVDYLNLNYNKGNIKKEVNFEIKPKEDKFRLGSLRLINGVLTVIVFKYHNSYYDMLLSDPIKRLKGAKAILITLFHELRHLKVYFLIKKDISNKFILKSAKELFFIKMNDKRFKAVYNSNHDNFLIEADANSSSKIRVNKKPIDKQSDDLSKLAIIVDSATKNSSTIVYNNIEYDRDIFIDLAVDEAIKRGQNIPTIKEYPVLLKEYNEDGSKKTLVELISNMINELEASADISNTELKQEAIKDIKELYFELIYKRLIYEDFIGLYEAANAFSQDSIKFILNSINDYFNEEKTKRKKINRGKYKALVANNSNKNNYIRNNKGKIRYIVDDYITFISVNKYLSTLNIESNKKYIKSLLENEEFKKKIPDYGFYLLKNGVKMSVKEFIETIFIPEYEKSKDKSNILLRFNEILESNVKSSVETEYLLKSREINRDYQAKRNFISSFLNSDILNKKIGKLDQSLIESIKLIRDINDPIVQRTVFTPMLGNYNMEGQYYSFSEQDISQFYNIFKIAKGLNNSKILNPNKIDYYRIFSTNSVISYIKDQMNKYLSSNLDIASSIKK